MKIALVGNPNVGKSSLFSRITGTHIITSNFPGTTIGVTRGTLSCLESPCDKNPHELFDAPGLYTIKNPSHRVESVAVYIAQNADLIINVIDSTQLERNLYLTQQLLSLGTPLIVALNLWDEARYRGIEISVDTLSSHLGAPVIPTISLTGHGVPQLAKTACKTLHTKIKAQRCNIEPSWSDIHALTNTVQTRRTRKKRFSEHLETITLQPVVGSIVALGVLASTFWLVSYAGSIFENVIEYCFSAILTPPLLKLHGVLSYYPFMQELLVGKVTNTSINYSEAMGMLTSGLFIPLAKVAPVVTIFYGILGLLEDCGYLPRLAVLADTLMHRFALHGFAVIPMILGAGCSVTGIVSTRILESRRQRIIASSLLSMTIPCASQTAVIISLTSSSGRVYVAGIFGTLFLLWYIMGYLLGTFEKTNYQELLIEVPPYRLPRIRLLAPKLLFRLRNFFYDAIPVTIYGIFILLVCNYVQIFDILGTWLSQPLGTLWGLEPTVIPILLMGMFRKEIALSFLHGLTLTPKQLFTAALLLAIYFPCVSVYTVLYKEFGPTTLGLMVLGMITLSTLVGFLAHAILLTV